MKTTIAVLNKKGGNAIPTALWTLKHAELGENAVYAIATDEAVIRIKDKAKLDECSLNGCIALGFGSTASKQSQPQMIESQDAMLLFDGRSYRPKHSIADFASVKQEYEKAAQSFVQNVEGEYAFAIAKPNQLMAGRDAVGVQPLYYSENDEISALASDKKSLWKLGFNEPTCFPPGHLATISKQRFQITPLRTLQMQQPKTIDMEEAVSILQKLLMDSVRERIAGEEKVAIAFSGGLDSSLVALLAKQCGAQVSLLHVSLENRPETDAALEAAESLDLPIQAHLFKESDVEKIIPNVVGLIEDPDPVKISIGIPFFWTAQKAAEAGFAVMLAGQGADELFGGYQRYVNQYLMEGDMAVRQTMFHDVSVIHETNIERDEKICIYHDIELRLPFASFALAGFAMSLPTEFKFEKQPDSLRKLALRAAAKKLGLPPAIADKPKKAVQYSTGISNALKHISKRNNCSLQAYIDGFFKEVTARQLK
jgi:asparagine synthase (glutamine-hydrolysing)